MVLVFGSCLLTYTIAKHFEEDRVEKVALNNYWNADIFLDAELAHFMTARSCALQPGKHLFNGDEITKHFH